MQPLMVQWIFSAKTHTVQYFPLLNVLTSNLRDQLDVFNRLIEK